VDPELAAGPCVEPHAALSRRRYVPLHRNEHGPAGCARYSGLDGSVVMFYVRPTS
jgi:hypothetical protein